jgi:hypothetical protein
MWWDKSPVAVQASSSNHKRASRFLNIGKCVTAFFCACRCLDKMNSSPSFPLGLLIHTLAGPQVRSP